ncbi:peptidylprolyl isomerase [Bacteroidota bacterium]|nr:peptidylprolyl isomerase [Bacteroidota bacterium]
MSIIQNLRDRAAVLLSVMIAISLIGFLVQDAFIGRSGNLFSGPSTTAGSVNSQEVDLVEFNQKVNAAEQSYRSQGLQTNEMMTQSIIENVWNGYIQEALINGEVEKLGLKVTPKELGAVLFSDDAPQEFRQMFTDRNTGMYDINAAKNWFNGVKKSTKEEDVRMVADQLINPIQINLLTQKYVSLFTQGSYVPTWMIEKMNADNALIASVDFAGSPYTAVSDSTVKITDQEISEYVNNHKDDFKQEHVKSLSYVSFSANPTPADSQKIYNALNQLKAEMLSTSDEKGFVTRNNTTLPFYDGFALKSKLQMGAKDSIIAMGVGSVIGPYIDGGSFVIAKKIASKTMPDSVRVRHILVGTINPQTGQETRADSVAKKRADSIFSVIKSGGNFAALAAQLSEDEGSKQNGGEYNFSSTDASTLDRDFSNYMFNKPKGSFEVIKTSFGYHVIEVLDQRNFEPAYKVAYLAKNIVASDETDNAASSAATQFAGSSRDAKSFDETAQKMKVLKNFADNVREMDYGAGQLTSRAMVKWAFENKVGTVSEPFDLKDQYVVAIVTNEIKEGVQPPALARVVVEPVLRNKKKAEVLSAKVGPEKNLEKIALILGGTSGSIDTLRFADPFVTNVGTEIKVIGAAFNKKNLSNVSDAITGQNGVFYVKVKNVSSLPSAAVDLASQKKTIESQLKQFAGYSTMEALRKSAKIVDKRRESGY